MLLALPLLVVSALGPLASLALGRLAQSVDLGFGLHGTKACSEGLGRFSDTGLRRGALGPIGSSTSGTIGPAGGFLAPARDLSGALAARVTFFGALPLDLCRRLANCPALAFRRVVTLRESGFRDRSFRLRFVGQAGRTP